MKKLISLLMIMMLLCGCGSVTQDTGKANAETMDLESISQTYLEKLKNFSSRGRNTANSEDNVEFDAYLEQVFIDQVKDDYTSLTNELRNYKDLGIAKPEVSLGEIEYGADEEAINEELTELEKLESFDYDTLSYRQQIDYECLEYSFYEDLSTVAYWPYSRILVSDASFVGNPVDYFTNYNFYSEEAIDDYLLLVGDVDRYFKDAITYTDEQYAAGIYTSDYSLDTTIEYIDSFTSKSDDNVLITSFNDSIDEVDFLEENAKETYKEKNYELVTSEVLPAYKQLAEKLKKYKGKVSSDDLKLSDVSESYAEAMFMIKSSNNTSIDQVYSDLIDAYNDSIDYLNSFDETSKTVGEFEEIYNDSFFSEGYETLVDYLIEKSDIADQLKEYFDYKIDGIDLSIVSNTTTAYYMSGPLDILHNNTIKVNPNLTGSDISLYVTLAHETVPGHMYQMNMYKLTDPQYIRESMSFIGYTEGYASYSEYIGLGYLGLSDELRDYIMDYIETDYYLSCIIDIAINYYGYDTKTLGRLLDSDKTTLSYYVNLFTDMASAYSPYGIGYLNMYSLYRKTKNTLGDKFDETEYNYLLIKNGPMPYPILESVIDEYIAAK